MLSSHSVFNLHDNSAPSVVVASSSSGELDDSDSDNFVTFFLDGLECTSTFLGAVFIGEGARSFNETWPCMYGRNVVIRLLDYSIANLNDSGPHESFTNKSSHTHNLRTPFEHSTRTTRVSELASS